jgi:hypothetical protein
MFKSGKNALALHLCQTEHIISYNKTTKCMNAGNP